MFSLIEICCTYVAYRKMLILAKIGPDSSRDTSEIARNQMVKIFYCHDNKILGEKHMLETLAFI